MELFPLLANNELEQFKNIVLNTPNLDINIQNEKKETLFYRACIEGQTDIVQFLLNVKGINVNEPDFELCSPFYVACKFDQVEVVKILLEEPRVDVNQIRDLGHTPFCVSCSHGRLGVIKLLLETKRDIDMNTPMGEGGTPLYMACQEGHTEIVKLLLKDKRIEFRNETPTPFFIACQQEHLEIVHLFLQDDRTDVNQGDSEDATPFFIACQNGVIELVKILLQSDRNIDIYKSWKGIRSPLQQAELMQTLQKQYWETEEEVEKRVKNCAEIVKIFRNYEANPQVAKFKFRKELGILNSLASQIFSLAVLITDDYFREDLRTPQSTDVIFEVEGEKIYCHKVILGARNKTLYSLFTNPKNSKMKSITFVGNHENHSVYQVQKWSKSSFLCILRKLYSEPYMHNDFEGQNLSEISQIASELKFQGTRAFYQLDPLSKSFSSLIEFYSDVPLFDSFTNVIINLQNGVQFLAHRVFLISRCNYFNAMIGIHSFWLETTQATPTVTLDHISWINFRVLIRYLYYDELNVLYDFDLENPTENMSFKKLNFLIEILSMSNEFLIDNLKNSCEKEISKFLDIKNVFEIYEVADTFEASSLKSACIELIFLNLEVLLISKSISFLGRKLILELEERMKAMTRGSHVSNFPFYCNSDDGTESDSGLSEDLNEVQEFNEFLNDEEIAMRLQFQFYNENNNRNSRANNSNRSRQNDNPPRSSPRNNSAKQKGKTKAKNNPKGKTPEKNSKVQKVENLEPIEDQIDVENMASSSSENHQNPVVKGGGKSSNKKNKKTNLEQVSNPTDDLESTNIESIENLIVCEVMESKSKIWASTSQSKNQPISFREILETEMDKKKNTPKPPKPIISTPVKSLPQENKQNTSKNEGPWKKINPGTEPVQLTFLDELEAQEKLKNEGMKQQRLKELQIASSAKVKSSNTSSPWAITSPKTVEVTKSPSFSQIQQQQHKDKVQKEKTLKKSFARIQAEEAALRELEKHYEKLAKEKGESFHITQTLND